MGCSTSASTLAKLKLHMVERASLGKILSVEQAILDSFALSSSLKDVGKISLDSTLGSLNASFSLGNGEKITKSLENLKVANDWLLSMLESFKSGGLVRGIQIAQKEVKSSVALEKAANTLESSGSASFEQDICIQADAAGGSKVDVTEHFLSTAKPHLVMVRPATVCIHKGTLMTFSKLAARDQSVWGIMLGREAWNGKTHVVSIVLANSKSNQQSVEDLMSHSAVAGRMASQGAIACGVVASGTEAFWREQSANLLGKFTRTCASPILVIVDFAQKLTGDVVAWEWDEDQDQPMPIVVSISYASQPKDISKRLSYNMCFADDMGVSHLEATTKKICEAMLKHALGSEKLFRRPSSRLITYRRLDVPADGYCGFYSLAAFDDLEQFEKIPRKDSGYAQNPQMVKYELENIKAYHESIVSEALTALGHLPRYRDAIQRVQVNPSFAPADLEWISQVCKATVRITCSKEAHMVQNTVCSKHFSICFLYLDMYIYIQYIAIYRVCFVCIYFFWQIAERFIKGSFSGASFCKDDVLSVNCTLSI